jgi:trimethylamine--corrinoid protein Co-methyltransferase
MRPTLNTLSDDLIQRVLDETKRVMGEVGMEIRGPELRQRLLDHGLRTDAGGERILFPPDEVDKAIASCPKSFTLYNRHGEPHAELGGNNVHFVPGSSGLQILDHRTGETRLTDSKDFIEYARLCDGLEHIAYLATAFSTNKDIESQVSDAWRLYMCLTTSKKPIVSGAFSEHGVPRMLEMLQLFRADRAELAAKPLSLFTITATGNFRYGEDSCQNLLDCVEAGIPIEIVPVTLMGLIAPVTLVGALVFHLHLDVAYVAIAKHLGLPCQAYMALSDGKLLDAQAGAETFGSALLAALAGVNSVSGPGMLDFVLTFSLAKLVFDNEACGQALHFVREIEPLDDLPTTELVRELIAEEHLITSPHTMKYWPRELYLTDAVVDRENRENWEKAGSKELYQRACEGVEKRLASYQPIETEPALDAEMRRLVVSGLEKQQDLPELPPLPDPARVPVARQRRSNRRRRAKSSP